MSEEEWDLKKWEEHFWERMNGVLGYRKVVDIIGISRVLFTWSCSICFSRDFTKHTMAGGANKG